MKYLFVMSVCKGVLTRAELVPKINAKIFTEKLLPNSLKADF